MPWEVNLTPLPPSPTERGSFLRFNNLTPVAVVCRTEKPMITVKTLCKTLQSVGLEKVESQRINFQIVEVGDYKINHLKRFGCNTILIYPKNGITCEKIAETLSDFEPKIQAGYVMIAVANAKNKA